MNTQKVFIPIHAWYNFAFYPFYSLKSIHRCPSWVFSCKRYCYGLQKLQILDAACMCQWELHVATSRCVSGSLVTPAQAMMTWPLSRRQFSLVQVSHAHATISLHWLAETQFHYWSDPVLVLILLLHTPREKICAHKSFWDLET